MHRICLVVDAVQPATAQHIQDRASQYHVISSGCSDSELHCNVILLSRRYITEDYRPAMVIAFKITHSIVDGERGLIVVRYASTGLCMTRPGGRRTPGLLFLPCRSTQVVDPVAILRIAQTQPAVIRASLQHRRYHSTYIQYVVMAGCRQFHLSVRFAGRRHVGDGL